MSNYTALSAALASRRQSGDRSPETLKLVATLLAINPDYATLWNYRREIIEAAACEEGGDGGAKLSDDGWKVEAEVRECRGVSERQYVRT